MSLGVASSLFVALLATPTGPLLGQHRRCNPGSPPDRRKFEAGDFLWPKLPGTYVPFSSGSSAGVSEERSQWMRKRSELVARLTTDGSPQAQALATELRKMTFEQFHTRYINGATPGANVPFGAGQLGTGHIAVLDVDDSQRAHVIEAMPTFGVRRVAYDVWLQARACEMVWHGRLRELSSEKRLWIAREASWHIGRPYDFWNLKLDDATSFYCSKLVWLSALKATGIAIDGDSSPGPRFWVSPKQLLSARAIVKLHSPQDYDRT